MSLNKMIFLIALLGCLSGCVAVGPDGESRFSLFEPSDPGKAGERYLLGRGVVADNQKAFRYFMMAAQDGDAMAQNEVAYLYATGKGTDQDYNKARFYYELAARQGLASAQYSLGVIYRNGLGVAVDKEKARSWFEQSARKGFEPAKEALK